MNFMYQVFNLKYMFCGCTLTFKGCLLLEAPMLSDVFKPALNRWSPKKGPHFDVFGPGVPQDVNLKKNTCWEGTSLDQTASFEPTCVKLSLLVWSLQVSKKQKKKKRQDTLVVYISRMRGATPSGRISTKLGKCVCLADVIKRAKFHH